MFMSSSDFRPWRNWRKYDIFWSFIFNFWVFEIPIGSKFGLIMFNLLESSNHEFESSKNIVLLSFFTKQDEATWKQFLLVATNWSKNPKKNLDFQLGIWKKIYLVNSLLCSFCLKYMGCEFFNLSYFIDPT